MPRHPALHRIVVTALLWSGLAVSANAENRAVVVANGDYRSLPDVPQVDAGKAIGQLKRAGYRVVEGRDLSAKDLRSALADLQRPDPAAGQRIVVLNGRFVHSRGETWFMGVDGADQGQIYASVTGLPVSVVVDLMRGGDAQSVLLLGTDQRRFDAGAGLVPGIGPVPTAAGVAVIAGYTDGIARAAATLAQPGATVRQALGQGESLRLIAGNAGPRGGTAPVVVAPDTARPGADPVVIPPGGAPPVIARPAAPSRPAAPQQPGAEEQAAWDRAKRIDTPDAYQGFLGKYPGSIYAGAARGRMRR